MMPSLQPHGTCSDCCFLERIFVRFLERIFVRFSERMFGAPATKDRQSNQSGLCALSGGVCILCTQCVCQFYTRVAVDFPCFFPGFLAIFYLVVITTTKRSRDWRFEALWGLNWSSPWNLFRISRQYGFEVFEGKFLMSGNWGFSICLGRFCMRDWEHCTCQDKCIIWKPCLTYEGSVFILVFILYVLSELE